MKKEWAILWAVMVLILCSAVSQASFDGAFIWLGWNPGWSQARWSAEMALMRDIGMNIIITGYSVNERLADYPTTLPVLTPSGHDPLKKILTDADTHGMEVYLGLVNENAWWSRTDAAYYDELAQLSMAVASELHSLYSSHRSLRGFYLPQEIDNLRFISEPVRQRLVQHLLKPVSDHIKTLNPELIFCAAPFYNPDYQQPAELQQWWIKTLTETPNFDLVIPQDGIGARPGVITLPIIEAYFTAYKAACDATGRTLWADLEVFEQTGTLEPPPTLDRIIGQIETVKPFVERIVIWEWQYIAPHHSIRALDFTENYRRYLKSKGSLENLSVGQSYTLSPSPHPSYPDNGSKLTDNLAPYSYDAQVGWNTGSPITVTIDLANEQDGLVNFRAWFLKASESGVQSPSSVQVSISSDGALFSPLGLLNAITDDNQSMNPWQLTLTTPVRGRLVRFEIQRSTGWVHCGELSVYRIPPQLISLGKAYDISLTPHASYPDDGSKLTDDNASFTWDAQVGWLSPAESPRITVDLVNSYWIQRVEAYFMRSDSSSVRLPIRVSAAVSENGFTFDTFGILNAESSNSEAVNRYFVDASGIGRFVQLEIEPEANWLMLSEIRIYGELLLNVPAWELY